MKRIETHTITIPYTGTKRLLRVCLPLAYESSLDEFDVLYMHDGQNLFDHKTAFGGCSWNAAETAWQLEREGDIRPVIIVGLDNEGQRRFDDYSPWKCQFTVPNLLPETCGGDGELYGRFFAEELRDFVDSRYRTKKSRMHTAVAGSSMGGLISAYLAAAYPETYGMAGIFSLASWFHESDFLEYLQNAKSNEGQKYFIRVGGNESPEIPEFNMPQLYIDSTLHYLRGLLKKEVSIDSINIDIAAGAGHNEKQWSSQMPELLRYFFGA